MLKADFLIEICSAVYKELFPETLIFLKYFFTFLFDLDSNDWINFQTSLCLNQRFITFLSCAPLPSLKFFSRSHRFHSQQILFLPLFAGFSALLYKVSAICRFLGVENRQRPENLYEREVDI